MGGDHARMNEIDKLKLFNSVHYNLYGNHFITRVSAPKIYYVPVFAEETREKGTTTWDFHRYLIYIYNFLNLIQLDDMFQEDYYFLF